jgi:transcriptional regulator with XRE-family HTH domain
MRKAERPTYSAVVGRFVRLERECKKVPLSTMARKLGCTVSGWSRVETGETTMNVNRLKEVCDALKVTPSALIAEVDAFWRRNYS